MKRLSLRALKSSSEFSVEGKVGSRREENYKSLAGTELRHRRGLWLLPQSSTGG